MTLDGEDVISSFVFRKWLIRFEQKVDDYIFPLFDYCVSPHLQEGKEPQYKTARR